MNTLPATDIKRRGMAAIEEALEKGPVHIVKHNRPAAVVLSEAEFERLTAEAARAAAQSPAPTGRDELSALDFLMSLSPGKRTPEQIRSQIEDERGGWGPA